MLMYKGAEVMQKRKSTPDLLAKEKLPPDEGNGQQKEEKTKPQVEEDEKFGSGRDGDNDVVTAPGKQMIQDGGEEEKKLWRQGVGEKSSQDGGPSQENQHSQKDPSEPERRSRSSREDRESGSSSRRRRTGSVGRTAEKTEKVDAATEIDDAVLVTPAATQSTREDGRSSRRRLSERTQDVPADGTSQAVVTTKGVQATQAKEDHQTQTTGNAAREIAKHNETVNFLTERIKILESEKTAVEKEKEETEKLLKRKMKEHKNREEEFMNLKAGYDRELRTVINEHKKVSRSTEQFKILSSHQRFCRSIPIIFHLPAYRSFLSPMQ